MLEGYKEYKTTNYDWLPQIPSHWEWIYLSQSCNEQKIKNSDNRENCVLSLSYGNIIRKKDINFGLVPKEYSNYQIVNRGNIILRLTDLQNDHTSLRTGIVKEKGIITSAYTCIKPHENPMYLQYLLHSYDTLKVFYGIGGGVRQSIGFKEIRNMNIPFPPRSEQDQIVRYLDWKVSMINKYINAKKKQIDLLKERKQAIINQAVTKGLEINVPMKESGIEWLGKIPEHWEVVPLRRIAKFVKTGGTPNGVSNIYYSEDGTNWYTPGDFTDDIFLCRSIRKLSILGEKEVKIFPPNSIFLIGIGGTLGKVAISKQSASCNQQINAIVCNPHYNEIFLTFYLRLIKIHIFNTAKYTTLPILNQEETKNISVLLLDVSEQRKTATYLLNIEEDYNASIHNLENQISFIQEYRTRLISDVVTGKVNVQNVKMPEFIDDDQESQEIIEKEDDE